MGADALLGRGHEECCQQPLVKRNLGTLKDSANSYSELLTAIAALVEAGAVLGALQLLALFGAATVGAEHTVSPTRGFEMLAGNVFVGENRISKVYVSNSLMPK